MPEFGDRAVRETIGAAAYEAARSKAHEIQPEHVWAALLRRPEPVVGHSIARLQISRSTLVQDLDMLVYGHDKPVDLEGQPVPCLELTLETHRLLAEAEARAKRAGKDAASITELFLAFLDGASGSLRDTFQRHGLTVQRVKQEVLRQQ